MNILIKSAKIIDINSKYHNKISDILVEGGKIKKIAKKIKLSPKSITNSDTIEYSAKNLHVSTGWLDIHANFGEPGYEERETLKTGCNAAVKGGFTGVLVMPNNKPNIDNKSMIDFINNMTRNNIVDVIPSGNITQNGEGNNIVEMNDMHKSGCRVFTDDKKSLQRNEVMKIAMLYSKDSNSLIMNYPNEKSISNNGYMNEGAASTRLGIKGIPAIAEEMMVDRDLNLCGYTGSRLHLSYISTENSLKKIKTMKKKGLKVTCDVAIHNLFLTDDAVNNFDTRYKVMPPLRTKQDNKALVKALIDGTIDVISSDHTPINDEYKKTEFDNAMNGIIGLETLFGLIGRYILPMTNLDNIVDKISTKPREILQMEKLVIEEGRNANFTFFDPELEWVFSQKDIKSKSINTPFIGEKLKGKALAVLNKGRLKEC